MLGYVTNVYNTIFEKPAQNFHINLIPDNIEFQNWPNRFKKTNFVRIWIPETATK